MDKVLKITEATVDNGDDYRGYSVEFCEGDDSDND